MQHKCKVTVIKKELYEDLQEKYLADPKAGACPFYEVGQEFMFERYGKKDDFWTMGRGTQCSEAWDAISRYIYTALQGGSIMRNWTNNEKMMIACCNDGTRPVVFKIERIDYKVLYVEGSKDEDYEKKITKALMSVSNVLDVKFNHDDNYVEVIVEKDVFDDLLRQVVENCGEYHVTKID
ncbi:MAG: TIGR04076 family protein [Clostridium sp.]|nr:TIGR04076 family protein [Clostridium sp.]